VLGQTNFSGLAAYTTARNFNQPIFLHAGPGGSLLIGDYGNNRVLRFSPVGTASPTSSPAAVPVLMLSGKKKIATSAPKVVLKGTAVGSITSVTAKVGKKTLTAAGTASWKLSIVPKSGKTIVTITAHGPGGDSAPVKVIITRP
jgi:hypothetical protein